MGFAPDPSELWHYVCKETSLGIRERGMAAILCVVSAQGRVEITNFPRRIGAALAPSRVAQGSSASVLNLPLPPLSSHLSSPNRVLALPALISFLSVVCRIDIWQAAIRVVGLTPMLD